MSLTSSVMIQSVSNFRLYCCLQKIQMLRKKVKLLLEQLQVCIFAKKVFGVRCTLRNTNSETTYYLLTIFLFRFNNLQGTANVPAVALSRLIALRGSKAVFLTSKRSRRSPSFFLYGSPPRAYYPAHVIFS